MVRYGHADLFPTETDAVLGPRTVALWRTSGADNYLRLAQPDTDCPPDPTSTSLDDGQTEPNRYAFYLVNRNPSRELSAPLKSWLIKGRAVTTYHVSAKTDTEHWVEFRPYLYVGQSSNPTENNYIDGDSASGEDGSSIGYDPTRINPVYAPNFIPAERETVAYYYAAALVQAYGSADYRVGVAVVVSVSSLDTVLDVQWYYVLFQGRNCLDAIAIPSPPSWSTSPWVRWVIGASGFQVLVNGTLIFQRTGSVGSWAPYRLIGMETSWGNTGGASPMRSWSSLGGSAWTSFIPIGRVAGVRSAFTQHEARIPVGNTTPIRLRARMLERPSVYTVPLRFRAGSTTYTSIDDGDGYYRPSTNPLATGWEVHYLLHSDWESVQLLERFETAELPADPVIEAEWVSGSSGVLGSTAQMRFRAANSALPVRVYLERGSMRTLLGTYTPSGSSWDTEGWVLVDWVRVPPVGAVRFVFEMVDPIKDEVVTRTVLDGAVVSEPVVSLEWVSASELPISRIFEVRATASGSAENLIIETVQDSIVTTRAVFSPPAIGYWSGETRNAQWVSSRPYGSFQVRARLESATATLDGTVLSPLLTAEWVLGPYVHLGQVMQVRARAIYIEEPITFSVRHKANEFLIATYSPPSGGWNNEWVFASWTTVPPTGNIEWVIRCGELSVSLWGLIYTPNLVQQSYGQRFSLKIPMPMNYWIIRSPDYAVSGRVAPKRLIRLGEGFGLEGTDQGRFLEIETQYDT